MCPPGIVGRVGTTDRDESTWVERMAEPALPPSSRFGFVLALLTLLLVAVAIAGLTLGDEPIEGGTLVAAWALLYAGGLAWAWLGMRPRAERVGRFHVASAALVLQGLTYLAFWVGLSLAVLTDANPLRARLHGTMTLGDVLLPWTFFQFLFIGPASGVLAMAVATRGGRMAFVQGAGIVAFGIVYSLS